MRIFYGLLLLALLAVVGVFAVQNDEAVTVRFLNWDMVIPLALVAGVSYLLGMFSGWTVVGFISRSLRRVTGRTTNR
jgi:uncharacterized integral membrane protein